MKDETETGFRAKVVGCAFLIFIGSVVVFGLANFFGTGHSFFIQQCLELAQIVSLLSGIFSILLGIGMSSALADD